MSLTATATTVACLVIITIIITIALCGITPSLARTKPLNIASFTATTQPIGFNFSTLSGAWVQKSYVSNILDACVDSDLNAVVFLRNKSVSAELTMVVARYSQLSKQHTDAPIQVMNLSTLSDTEKAVRCDTDVFGVTYVTDCTSLLAITASNLTIVKTIAPFSVVVPGFEIYALVADERHLYLMNNAADATLLKLRAVTLEIDARLTDGVGGGAKGNYGFKLQSDSRYLYFTIGRMMYQVSTAGAMSFSRSSGYSMGSTPSARREPGGRGATDFRASGDGRVVVIAPIGNVKTCGSNAGGISSLQTWPREGATASEVSSFRIFAADIGCQRFAGSRVIFNRGFIGPAVMSLISDKIKQPYLYVNAFNQVNTNMTAVRGMPLLYNCGWSGCGGRFSMKFAMCDRTASFCFAVRDLASNRLEFKSSLAITESRARTPSLSLNASLSQNASASQSHVATGSVSDSLVATPSRSITETGGSATRIPTKSKYTFSLTSSGTATFPTDERTVSASGDSASASGSRSIGGGGTPTHPTASRSDTLPTQTETKTIWCAANLGIDIDVAAARVDRSVAQETNARTAVARGRIRLIMSLRRRNPDPKMWYGPLIPLEVNDTFTGFGLLPSTKNIFLPHRRSSGALVRGVTGIVQFERLSRAKMAVEVRVEISDGLEDIVVALEILPTALQCSLRVTNWTDLVSNTIVFPRRFKFVDQELVRGVRVASVAASFMSAMMGMGAAGRVTVTQMQASQAAKSLECEGNPDEPFESIEYPFNVALGSIAAGGFARGAAILNGASLLVASAISFAAVSAFAAVKDKPWMAAQSSLHMPCFLINFYTVLSAAILKGAVVLWRLDPTLQQSGDTAVAVAAFLLALAPVVFLVHLVFPPSKMYELVRCVPCERPRKTRVVDSCGAHVARLLRKMATPSHTWERQRGAVGSRRTQEERPDRFFFLGRWGGVFDMMVSDFAYFDIIMMLFGLVRSVVVISIVSPEHWTCGLAQLTEPLLSSSTLALALQMVFVRPMDNIVVVVESLLSLLSCGCVLASIQFRDESFFELAERVDVLLKVVSVFAFAWTLVWVIIDTDNGTKFVEWLLRRPQRSRERVVALVKKKDVDDGDDDAADEDMILEIQQTRTRIRSFSAI